MNCPKCQSPMAAVKVGIVEVDRCTGCGGMWFDSLEDEWLKTPEDAAALDVGDPGLGATRNAQGRIDCPKCHTRTIRMVDVELLRPLLRRRRVSGPGQQRPRGPRAPLAHESAALTCSGRST